MSKVELIKNGRVVHVHPRVADHLLSRASYGYMRRDMVAAPVKQSKPEPQDDTLSALRAQYQKVVGKKAFHGWSAEEIEQKIAEHKE